MGFLTNPPGITNHNLLSTEHPDTVPASVVKGDLIVGNSTPKWARLPVGTTQQVLTIDPVTLVPTWDTPLPVENGFQDDPNQGATARSKTLLSWNDGSRTLTLSIIAPNTEYIIFAHGFKRTITTTKTSTIPDSEGIHLFYFDANGDLQNTPSYTTDLILLECLVAVMYWDAVNKKGILVGDERHGREMDASTHLYEHATAGAKYGDGLALGNMSTDGSGDLPAHAELSVANGSIWDEDLKHTITDGAPQDLSPIAQIPLFYRSGATGLWRQIAATNFPVTTTGTGRAAYNQFTGATWQLTEVANTQYTLTHLFATNDILNPIIGIVGQATYTTLTNARAGADVEIASLLFGQIQSLTPEYRAVATIIWQTNNGYANAVKSRIRTTDTGGDYVDWRTSNLSRTAVSGVTDHGLLSGLLDDDHPGAAWLAGRAGGQTLYGGNAANDDLVLEPTSSGTKTSAYITLAAAGGLVGIGTSTPAAKLAINGGLHVGGDADPGDNNQIIDGILEVGGGGFGSTYGHMNIFAGNGSTIGANVGLRILGAGSVGNLLQLGFGYHGAVNPAAIVGFIVTNDGGNTLGDLTWYTRSAVTDTAPSEVMRLSASGNLGVGTSGAAAKLAINGGCHVGGNTDPGDNNLDVDGTVYIGGKAIVLGANDSAGAGYRTMKIENA